MEEGGDVGEIVPVLPSDVPIPTHAPSPAVWIHRILQVCVEYTSAIKRLTAAALSTVPSSLPPKPLIFRRDARQSLAEHNFINLVGGKDGESGFETSAFVVGESTKRDQKGEGTKREQDMAFGLIADTVLTSPPYPGVYDYLSHARSTRSGLGRLSPTRLHGEGKDSSIFLDPVPSGRNWASAWTVGEVGARSEVRRRRRSEASSGEEVMSIRETKWESDQKDWLLATTSALRAGGRLGIMIGDGDGIDTRSSLLGTVEMLGNETALEVVGWVTLRAVEGTRRSMRTEHLLLLKKSKK